MFRDLGFSREEAENLKIRSDLTIRPSRLIESRGLTQATAAELFGVSQPRVSDLKRGRAGIVDFHWHDLHGLGIMPVMPRAA